VWHEGLAWLRLWWWREKNFPIGTQIKGLATTRLLQVQLLPIDFFFKFEMVKDKHREKVSGEPKVPVTSLSPPNFKGRSF